MKYIELNNCVKFINNRCYAFLSSVTTQKYSNNDDQIILSSGEYNIYNKNSTNWNLANNNLDIGKINRVNIKDDEKIKYAILLNKHFSENTQKITVKYINLFEKEDFFSISKRYSNEIINVLKKAFKNVPQNDNDMILKINNSCEFCERKIICIQKTTKEERLELIPLFSTEDIQYLHNQNIYSVDDFKKQERLKETAPEGLKDKYEDIQNLFNNKENKNNICNNKYFLNWSNYDKEIKYAVNFEGHSDTDIVYAFSYKQIYLEKAENKHIILKTSSKSQQAILTHYANIISLIYELLKSKEDKDVVFYALAPYERKNFKKIIETILDYKEECKDIIPKTLIVAEYFGMDYYSEEKIITYANPYVDTWVDLKSIIEKYICTEIPIINSFTDVYMKLCDKEINSDTLNSHNYSWALKSQFINDVWKGQSKETIINHLNIKLSNIINLNRKVFELLRDITIYPERRDFTNEGSFLSRFILKETITSIKEYKQEYADYTFDRLIEKGLILQLANIECLKKSIYDNYTNKKEETVYKYQYQHRFDYDKNSDFDDNGMIEFFENENNFNEVIKRQFNFDNIVDLNLEKNEFVRKDKKIENSSIYVLNSNYDTVNDIQKKDGTTTIINNTAKILNNLQHYKNVNLDSVINVKPDKNVNPDSVIDAVFNNVTYNKQTLLLGPPGTGKTYTIGKVVNKLIKENPSLNILVTGFTHLSIENCLIRIKENKENNITIGKWKVIKDSKCNEYDIVLYEKKKSNTLPQVLGSSIYKLSEFDNNKFNYIIVDEASQMKIPEFLMTYQVASENTHFLIVGDDNQLPPIIKNKYLNFDKKDILDAKSIFSYIKEKNPNCIISLKDCYRMNAILCKYPESKIYTEGFRPPADKKDISEQKLDLKNNDNDSSEFLNILNTNYPLVLCLVDNKGAKKNCSEIEAKLCANLSKSLYDNLQNDNCDDEKNFFWGKDLAIVSPHHSHIKLIKKELSDKFQAVNQADKNFFVDTVDKMQGQEADTVIVSYGVTDPQIACKEKEFIYNRNRLNVSITRAKKKLIVIISKELLNIEFKLIDNADIKEDIDFILDYIKYIKGGNKIHCNDNFVKVYGMPFKKETFEVENE